MTTTTVASVPHTLLVTEYGFAKFGELALAVSCYCFLIPSYGVRSD